MKEAIYSKSRKRRMRRLLWKKIVAIFLIIGIVQAIKFQSYYLLAIAGAILGIGFNIGVKNPKPKKMLKIAMSLSKKDNICCIILFGLMLVITIIASFMSIIFAIDTFLLASILGAYFEGIRLRYF